MAATVRQKSKFPGDRPCRLFWPCYRTQENPAGTAPLHRGTGRAAEENVVLNFQSCLLEPGPSLFSTVGQSTSSSAKTHGSLIAAEYHSRQAGKAITASI